MREGSGYTEYLLPTSTWTDGPTDSIGGELQSVSSSNHHLALSACPYALVHSRSRPSPPQYIENRTDQERHTAKEDECECLPDQKVFFFVVEIW